MGKTSSEVKERYNNKVYDKITVRLPKKLVAAFKAKCTEDNVSQAQIVKKAIEKFINE